jgi:6-phosphogluconolactonase (cycloisomerase 2 family)
MFSFLNKRILAPKSNMFLASLLLSKDDRILITTYYRENAVVVYDFKKNVLLKKLNILKPHASTIHKNWLIISSENKSSAIILVYNLNNFKKVSQYNIKKKKLVPHSMCINKNLLFISFCEGTNKTGLVMVFQFNSLVGKIDMVTDVIQKPFLSLGDTKGVCTDQKKKFLFITFESEPINFVHLFINKLLYFFFKIKFVEINNKNGIAIFEIYTGGKISKKPIKIITFINNPRLEDIKIYKNKLALVDLVNNIILIYKIDHNLDLNLITKLTANLNSPHCACFYNEGKKLLVANTYIKVVNKKAKFWYFNKSSNKPFTTFDMLNS